MSRTNRSFKVTCTSQSRYGSQGRGVTPAAMEARQPGTYRRTNPPGAINWVDRLNGDAGGTGRAGKQVWGQLLSTL